MVSGSRMRALLLSKYRHLEITEIPALTLVPGEVLVRFAACGIRASDAHGYDGFSGGRIPPIVMGHQASGRVAAVGDGVQRARLCSPRKVMRRGRKNRARIQSMTREPQ
jgi:D-arabinose 1-dehydrogenase-like Zn-dependent alcohol dehydrogenase